MKSDCDSAAFFSEETALSEITIAADGRILVFGSSLEVLDLLHELWPQNDDLARRLGRAHPEPGVPGLRQTRSARYTGT